MLFIALGLGACSGTHETPRERALPAAVVAVVPGPGLNVPGLLNLSIDELSQRLGPRLPLPAGFADPVLVPLLRRNDPLDSSALFRRRGLAMVASYDHDSRLVSDLLLLGSNENELMSRAQLRLGTDQYLVLPVFQERAPTRLLGLRVLTLAAKR